jgi:hypothetical protein
LVAEIAVIHRAALPIRANPSGTCRR